jgi:2-iminoacetate synthase
MVRHTNHLEACYNVGPHRISFPRLQAASNMAIDEKFKLSDADFARMVAILRLAVPYTGLICTAREKPEVRREVLQYGVSQIDGGTKLEIGAYAEKKEESQDLNREQFQVNDSRSLHNVIDALLDDGYLPSFCTACYRKGRTGEHFMEFSVPGFIKRFCTPNAIFTLAEYLEDYATEAQKQKGYLLIETQLQASDESSAAQIRSTLANIWQGERDRYL